VRHLERARPPPQDPERLLQANPEALAQFKLIIATDLSEAAVLALSDLCWARQIPLMVVRTFGLVGYLRIVVPEHAGTDTARGARPAWRIRLTRIAAFAVGDAVVLDGRPDNAPVDLRLDRPLPGVTALVDALDWDAMDSQQRSHTPWLLILLHFLRQWHAEHGGRAPETRAEKDEFKQRVRAFKYNVGQKNFDEAVANAHRVWIPSSVRRPRVASCLAAGARAVAELGVVAAHVPGRRSRGMCALCSPTRRPTL